MKRQLILLLLVAFISADLLADDYKGIQAYKSNDYKTALSKGESRAQKYRNKAQYHPGLLYSRNDKGVTKDEK